MKIAAGADHAGIAVKQAVVRPLRAQGHEVVDVGTFDGETSVDYPDYAHVVAAAVAAGEAERGVLVCGTGMGMCIAANKYLAVRRRSPRAPRRRHRRRQGRGVTPAGLERRREPVDEPP